MTAFIASRIQWLLLFSILMSHASFLLVDAFMGSLRNKEQPVRLRIHRKASQKVKTLIAPKNKKGGKSRNKSPSDYNWPLQEYMQLPAAQYACVPLPIQASLDRVHGKADEFTLQVPPMQFPISTRAGEIEITPKVRAKVIVEPDKVVIQSLSCVIDGSKAVQEWKLNDRYELDVCATLTWEKGNNNNGLFDKLMSDNASSNVVQEDGVDADVQSSKGDIEYDSSLSSSSSSQSLSSSSNLFQEDTIRIQTDLAIDVYPPPIKRIQMIPKRLLAKIGNMVLKYVLGLLLEAFLEGLQQDYEQWASCPDYRAERAKLEDELQLELQALEIQRQKNDAKEMRRQTQRQRREQRNSNSNNPIRMEDDSGGGGGNAFSFQNLSSGGFWPPRRRRSSTSVAARVGTANTATLSPPHQKLRRGERIIRLIRNNHHPRNNN